ncbi:MAG: metallophosphoesterase [Kiritimatiellae bacterium]|nr:metallophosphoesterase [Kiritimatiellia bacterium]
MQNRREFIGTLGAAVAAAGTGRADGTAVAREGLGAERLRIGLLADIHLTVEGHRAYFEKALRDFDKWKCDGVLICGDIADYGLQQQLKYVADAWWSVFPDGKGSDGRPVANLIHYGDHDSATWYDKRPEYPKVLGGADERESLLFYGENHKKYWEMYFHEPFSYYQVKTVKGYTFILNHFRRGTPDNREGNNAPGLEELVAGLKLDPDKPFFYSQHRPARDTNYLPGTWGQDAGDTTRIFSKYPNAVFLSGHIHRSLFDDRSMWQGAFNSVQVPSLSYNCTRPGRENSYAPEDRPPHAPFQTMPRIPVHTGKDRHGIFMTVYEKGMVFKRWNFATDVSLGEDWIVPFSSFRLPPDKKPYSPEVRAKTCPVPQFAPGAEVSVACTEGEDRSKAKHRFFQVEFPPAQTAARADEYSVTLELRRCDLVRTLVERRVFAPDYMTGVVDPATPVTCRFPEADVPEGWDLRFVVRPMNAYAVAGAAISTPWEYRLWGKTDEEARAAFKKSHPLR